MLRTATEVATVLIVDDNPIDRDLFRRFLQGGANQRFSCIEGEDGRSGLEQFRRLQPDCVILDLNLPDIDGLELLRLLLQKPDPCPVIVTTAYGSEQVAVDAMKAGAADYLVKGTTTADGFVHTIENALEKCALLRQVEQQRVAIEERNRELKSALDAERLARSAVEESERRYRTLTEAIPQIVWTAAHPSGDLDYINERWATLTGTPPADALSRPWIDLIIPEDRARVTHAWQSSLRQVAPLEVECRIHAADNTFRWQLVRALPLVQDQGPAKWLGTFTDVEDQKRAEQLLRQRQKLESIGLLAGGVAHDFNNLLAGIIGGVSYTLDSMPVNHELRPMLEGALKAGERAAHLTRQMLAYAGKGRFLVENVDLSQVVQATCELIKASIPKSIELKLLMRSGLRIQADASQLQQVIMNLILNAAEAIPPETRGLIFVQTDAIRIDTPKSTWAGDLTPGDYVVFEVRDNGCGMDAGTVDRIFDPFFTTKFTGRGLGLAAVQGILRTNKSAIEVDSRPGKGSTFRVLMPAAEQSVAPAVSDLATPVTSAKRGRILVVDDEEIVRNIAKLSLERAGHRVEVVPGGEEAIDAISRSTEPCSAVILDLSMPGLDGQQTFEAIRRVDRDLPIIICSGYSDIEIQARFDGLTVSGFLQKPFNSQGIQNTVADVLKPN